MKTKKIIINACFFLVANLLSAENYIAYLETFGNPDTTLKVYCNPPEGVTVMQITDNQLPNFYAGVSGRTAVNFGAESGVGPGWNLSADYCSVTTHGRYGIVTSNIFDSNVPVSSHDNLGNGFFAFFRRYTGYTSVLRMFVPADRIVPGEKYTISGWAANGYGSNVPNCDVSSPDFKIRLAHFPTNISEDGVTYDGTWNRSDLSTVFNSSTWTAFSKEAPMAALDEKGMLFEIVCNATKSSIVLLDDLTVTGMRPIITGVFTPIALTESNNLSEVRTVSCNHAGITPVTLTLSGENRSCFTLCDENGVSLSNNTIPKTGGSYSVRFTPDGSKADGNYAATLTVSASADESYGAEVQIITLTGKDIETSSYLTVLSSEQLISFENPVENELVFNQILKEEKFDITIYDSNGRLIKKHTGHQMSTPLNVSYLSLGNYIIHFSKGNKAVSSHNFMKK
jgi:hypothetical protein